MSDAANSGSRPASSLGPDSTGITIIGAQSAREALGNIARAGVQWADEGDAEGDDPVAADNAAHSGAADTAAVQHTTKAEPQRVVDVSDDGQLSFEASDAGRTAHAPSPTTQSDATGPDAATADDTGGIDRAWMDAGDATLGDLLGGMRHTDHVDDAVTQPDPDPAPDNGATQPSAASLGMVFNPGSPDDDVFPDHMYANSRGSAATFDDAEPGEDTGMIVASANATLERRAQRIGDRRAELRSEADGAPVAAAPAPKAARAATGEASDDRWGAFAGSGPRWRDEARDWADVDQADTSLLGDEATRVGTLNASRSESSDLYAIDDDEPEVLKIDAFTRDRNPDQASGGSQQRRGGSSKRADRSDSSNQDDPDKRLGGSQAGSKQAGGKQAGSNSAGNKQPASVQTPVTTRIGTGLLLALVVGLIFTFTGVVGAAVVAAVAIAMASIELMHALRNCGFRPAIPAVAGGLLAVVAAGMWRGERGVLVAMLLSAVSIAAWFLFGAERERPAANMSASFLAFGYPAIGAAAASLLLHGPHGLGLLMPAVIGTVANDVFAYVGGRAIGRRPLTAISPNKTIEGLIVGVLGTVAVSALVFGRLGWAPWNGYPQAIALGLAVAVAAPMGDLIESQLKRDLDVKDMGHLLPGHGGVFDRIDAMLLAVPAVWLVALATGHL